MARLAYCNSFDAVCLCGVSFSRTVDPCTFVALRRLTKLRRQNELVGTILLWGCATHGAAPRRSTTCCFFTNDRNASGKPNNRRFLFAKASAYTGTEAPCLNLNTLSQDDHGATAHVAMQLWDTAGQERFRSMAPMYYRGATAAVIVFDVTKKGSWENLETWRSDLLSYAESGVEICIAGNKSDQPCASTLNLEICRAKCREWGASLHFTSALSGCASLRRCKVATIRTRDGVEDLFYTVAQRAFRQASQKQRINVPKKSVLIRQPASVCC